MCIAGAVWQRDARVGSHLSSGGFALSLISPRVSPHGATTVTGGDGGCGRVSAGNLPDYFQ